MRESLYQGNKDWEYEGEKIIDRKPCGCGKGEILSLQRTYSPEKSFKSNQVFYDSRTNCDNCIEIEKVHKEFCNQLDKKFFNQLLDIKSDINNICTELKYFTKIELGNISVKSKKELFIFFQEFGLNQYGTLETFYKHTKGQNIREILIDKMEKGDFEFIPKLYRYTKTPMPLNIKKQLESISSLDNQSYTLKNEITLQKKEKLSELQRG